MNQPETEPVRRPVVVTTQTDHSLIDDSAFIAPCATVLGEVVIGEGVSVWFGAVMRGDTERIEIGAGANVQDKCVLHCDPGKPCIIGKGVTIGHAAVVHGATVEDGALIGIGAIILNGATIGRGAIIGAGALVTENTEIPAGMLAVGSPAKPIKPVSEDLAKRCEENSAHYVKLGKEYKRQYQEA
ncbi:gamma carbonic anhydrase family protein [Neorhodopirellula lusitana]|uniref:gamma carbonic anhydrase family protein n=1 Tax=Neorhodopirellula lusitana TaxID=445327 RepID=UPI00384C0A45